MKIREGSLDVDAAGWDWIRALYDDAVLETDGTTTYSLKSFDDGGARINPAAHTYAVDGVSPGVTTDFPPTVIVQTTPVAPLATESVLVSAAVNDRESPITSVVLNYALDGVLQPPVAMTLAGGAYQATIPAEPDGVRVDFAVTGSTGGQTTTSTAGSSWSGRAEGSGRASCRGPSSTARRRSRRTSRTGARARSPPIPRCVRRGARSRRGHSARSRWVRAPSRAGPVRGRRPGRGE